MEINSDLSNLLLSSLEFTQVGKQYNAQCIHYYGGYHLLSTPKTTIQMDMSIIVHVVGQTLFSNSEFLKSIVTQVNLRYCPYYYTVGIGWFVGDHNLCIMYNTYILLYIHAVALLLQGLAFFQKENLCLPIYYLRN